jgi:hypothetical protein
MSSAMGCLAYGSTPCKAGSFGPRVTQKYFTTQFTNQTRQGALGRHIGETKYPNHLSPICLYICLINNTQTLSRKKKERKREYTRQIRQIRQIKSGKKYFSQDRKNKF